MDILEQIEMEYQVKAKLIDEQLAREKALREERRAERKRNKMKVLVRRGLQVFLALFITGILVGACTLKEPKFDESDYFIESYTVRRGDTLWSIGDAVTDNVDLRIWVWEVKQLNNMDSSDIFPDEVIKIYIEKEQ